MNKFLLFLPVVLFALNACNSPKTEKEEVAEDFAEFYNQFHTDSLFQMSRISFPLAGIPNLSDTMNVTNYKWTEENWVMQKILSDPNNEFKLDRNFIGDKLVTETINHKSVGLEMIRRFAYTSDGWKLIYYQSFNLINN